MDRRLGIIIVALGAAAVVGAGVTSSLADEAGVEARVGELRGAILSLFAPAGAVRPPRSAKSRCRPKMEKSRRSFHRAAPRLWWRQKGSRRRGQSRPGRHKRESPR